MVASASSPHPPATCSFQSSRQSVYRIAPSTMGFLCAPQLGSSSRSVCLVRASDWPISGPGQRPLPPGASSRNLRVGARSVTRRRACGSRVSCVRRSARSIGSRRKFACDGSNSAWTNSSSRGVRVDFARPHNALPRGAPACTPAESRKRGFSGKSASGSASPRRPRAGARCVPPRRASRAGAKPASHGD